MPYVLSPSENTPLTSGRTSASAFTLPTYWLMSAACFALMIFWTSV
jgi:hypothetical protein